MHTTTALAQIRDAVGTDNVRYRAECLRLRRCHKHPAYSPGYCPVCGTAREIGRR